MDLDTILLQPYAAPMGDPAEALGQEVGAGTYVPSMLADCTGTLPMDQSPEVIRLTQFVLFSDPKADVRSPDPPNYLIFQQYQTGPNNQPPKPVLDGLITPIATALIQSATGEVVPGPVLPPPPAPSRSVSRAARSVAAHLR